jgi:hypothetical protein
VDICINQACLCGTGKNIKQAGQVHDPITLHQVLGSTYKHNVAFPDAKV